MISLCFGFGELASGLSAHIPCSLRAAGALLRSERLTALRILPTRFNVVALLAATLLAPSGLRARENTGTVRGFVYEAATGTPLSQVNVEMIGELTVTATTTNDGSFVVEGIPAGLYTVGYASANHQDAYVKGLEVIAGEIADASMAMSMRVRPTVASSAATQQAALVERKPISTVSTTIRAEESCDETSSDASVAIAKVGDVTVLGDSVPPRDLLPRYVRAGSNSMSSGIRASGESAVVIEPSTDEQLSTPEATDNPGVQKKVGAAIASRGGVRIGRNGLRIRSRGGAFTSEMHLRSQIRFSSPFASAPRRQEHFLRSNGNDMRFRRARFKADGQLWRPWIQYKTEYDLVNTRMLDLRVTIQKWEWLQFRFGQWKTEFGRERVSSSGRQEFVERSIVNRQFTADRQKGFTVLGRVKSGTRADSRYYAGVFTGNGRGFRSSGAGSLDNRDGAPMWFTRYQWNFLKDDPGFSQSDLEYHKAPVAAISISALSNRSRFTRFSGGGGGRLDGFEVGLPGQFAVRQAAEDFVLKYRGLFLQHEFHWKKVRDRIYHRITSMSGATVQGGYFFHYMAPWVPKQLELGLRYATVDQDHARLYDRITESAFVMNWFMEGHNNKLTVDATRYRLLNANGTYESTVQIRVQWDVSF